MKLHMGLAGLASAPELALAVAASHSPLLRDLTLEPLGVSEKDPNFESGAKSTLTMFGRSRFLSFPMVIGAVIIGVVSGKAIFGPPLDEYWKKKHQEEAAAAAAKEKDSPST